MLYFYLRYYHLFMSLKFSKRIVFIALIVFAGSKSIMAQQQLIFSHYYWNEQLYNPAYAGSKDALHVQGVYRNQWTGIDGAPTSIAAAVHSPLKNDKFALGLSLFSDKIGAMGTNGFTLQYAYRLSIANKYKLSFGLQGGLQMSNIDESLLNTDDGLPDPVSGTWNLKGIIPIVGAGIYFYGDQFSVGFGVPQLINENMLKEGKQVIAPVNHYFISGAYQFNFSDDFRLLPTATLRINGNSPIQAEMQVSAILYDQFQIGTGIRTDKSAVFLAQYMPQFGEEGKKHQFRIGYSYDLAWKPLRSNTGGTHELMVSFTMGKKSIMDGLKRIQSPRYF